MDGFASKDVLAAYRMTDHAFRLGRIHRDHGTNFDCGIDDDRGLFIEAGTRSGKGTTLIIPALLEWQGGAYNVDPKGENASLTAMRRARAEDAKGTGTAVRKFLGQRVAILDPMGNVRGPAKALRVTYDPLRDIDIGTDRESQDILDVVDACIMSDGGGDSVHFNESVATLMAGAIEALLHKTDKRKHSLLAVADLFRSGLDGLADFLDGVETPAGLAAEAKSILDEVEGEERGAFRTTASRQFKWLADPRIRRHLAPSAFSLKRAVRENWSIYVCLPPDQIPRQKRWMRILTNMALSAKMDSPFDHHGPQTLFLLDEFNALGHFQLIEDAAGYMAGYGIKLVPVIQNIGQVKKHYAKNWETFLGNAGAIIGFGLNDLETEQYLSDRMGKIMVWEESVSGSRTWNRGAFTAASRTENRNMGLHERAVLWPNEIHALGARQQMRGFVVPSDSAPFMIERRNYWDTFPKDHFDSPDHIKTWEAQHG
jgi:type IV secretion system protein VirD4